MGLEVSGHISPSLSPVQWLLHSRRERSTEADFGFKNVPKEEKQGMVRDVFSKVAENYDVMNDVMSVGAHRYALWSKNHTMFYAELI